MRPASFWFSGFGLDFMSSLVSKWRSFSNFGNKKKSQGARYWEKGGWGRTVWFLVQDWQINKAVLANYLTYQFQNTFNLIWNRKKNSGYRLHIWLKPSCFFFDVEILCQLWILHFCLNVVAINKTLISHYSLLHECCVIVGLFKELRAGVHQICVKYTSRYRHSSGVYS